MRPSSEGTTGISTMTSKENRRVSAMALRTSSTEPSPSSSFTLKRTSSSPRSAAAAQKASSRPAPDV